MATVIPQDRQSKGAVDLTYTTLDGSSDGFTYSASTQQLLIIKNDSGGPLNPILVGNATSYDPPGYEPALDVSTGYDVGSIADGTSKSIYLASIKEILGTDGTVSINSGTGLDCALLEG